MTRSDQGEQHRINRRNLRIEWGDCDPAGIVYFPRYFEIFDACTAAAFEAAGLPKPQLIKTFGIIGIPAVDIRASFHAPCTFGEDILVETQLGEWGRSSFKVHHRLLNRDVLSVEGFEVRVWTARDSTGRLGGQTIPREVIERFRVPA